MKPRKLQTGGILLPGVRTHKDAKRPAPKQQRQQWQRERKGLE